MSHVPRRCTHTVASSPSGPSPPPSNRPPHLSHCLLWLCTRSKAKTQIPVLKCLCLMYDLCRVLRTRSCMQMRGPIPQRSHHNRHFYILKLMSAVPRFTSSSCILIPPLKTLVLTCGIKISALLSTGRLFEKIKCIGTMIC